MDNPWANAWDDVQDSRLQTQWPTGPSWDPSTTAHFPDTPSQEDAAQQDQRAGSHSPALVAAGPRFASVSDHQSIRSISPPCDSPDIVPESTDAILRNIASVSVKVDPETTPNPPDDNWNTAWTTASSSNTGREETRHLDQWEAVRQEKEKLNRAVPPELLDSILRHCQKVSQEIWPEARGTNDEDNWRQGFVRHADVAAILAQLIPANSTLPPVVQFSATATAKAMNEALKVTRHLSVSTRSPISRLLASKGSLEWEKSIKAKQDIIPDTAHVGWRVLEKEDRINTHPEESKSRKATSGLLSFWNRRTSAIQAAPVEIPREHSSSPAGSSLESIKSTLHPPFSRAASPSKAITSFVAPPPSTDSQLRVVTTPSAPSAVSRFLNHFSRIKGIQHNSLALSSDDLEFLSDIVPSASDPPDDDVNDSAADTLTGASHSSLLPPKLPSPIPPPPKQPTASSRPSSALGLGFIAGANVVGSAPSDIQMQIANHTSNVPLLAPPLSPEPATSLSYTYGPPTSLKKTAGASGQSNLPVMQQKPLTSSESNSHPHSFTLPPPQKNPPLLSIPPLLPPPPVSPPQTPRPTTFLFGHSSMIRSAGAPSFNGPYDSDDEFSAFASFPPSAAAPFPSSEPYPPPGPPSPPSPPTRRTYERTHYPSSSSTSSTLSPASQSSLDQLCSTKSSVSASLDSFDDFVSPPPVVRSENKNRTPSPPPLPVKYQFQHQQFPRVDTFASRVYHAHTPSQTSASPTVHTSLVNSAFSVPSAEHQRTQSLVNRAAACGGLLWPNTSNPDESRVRATPPSPSSSMSPKTLIGEESFDLLGNDDAQSGGPGALPAPLSTVGYIGMRSTSRTPFGVAGSSGKGFDLRSRLQPSPPPLPSTSAPIPSFSSLGGHVALSAPNPGPLQFPKPKQTGGLSAQDLSFFEGL